MINHDCVFDRLESFLTKYSIKDRKVWDSLKTLRQTDGMNCQEAEQIGLLVEQFVEELGHESVKQDLLKVVEDLKKALVRRP